MLKRVLIGVLIFLVTLGAILLGLFISPICLGIFFALLTFLCEYEMVKAFGNRIEKRFYPIIFVYAAFLCVPAIIYIAYNGNVDFDYGAMTFLWLIMSLTAIYFVAVFKNIQKEKLFDLPFVLFYPALPMFAFTALLATGIDSDMHIGITAVSIVFVVSSLTDVFAYFGGITMGKHKMSPHISPKKTWEGAVGGIIGGLIGAIACYFVFEKLMLFGLGLYINNSIWIYLLFGILGSVVTQIGDLVASLVKRIVDLKDYSHILGNHGGIMDRLDGAMFNACLTFLILSLVL